MELIVIRHGIAEDHSPGLADQSRRLTPKGVRKFARVARGLGRLDLRLNLLLHSPMLRAVETAELLVDLLDGESRVTSLLARAPSEELLAAFGAERVAVVGHEPWLGELCSWLVTGDRRFAAGFAFDKGGVAWLSGTPSPGRMRLKAWLPPRILRKV